MTMNSNQLNPVTTTVEKTFAQECLASCKKLLARLEKAKNSVLGEFRDTIEEHNRVLQLAVNEAESLAWQTGYPHLFFPALAVEKAQAVTRWHNHQHQIQEREHRLALAA
jgi:hypothetical protein